MRRILTFLRELPRWKILLLGMSLAWIAAGAGLDVWNRLERGRARSGAPSRATSQNREADPRESRPGALGARLVPEEDPGRVPLPPPSGGGGRTPAPAPPVEPRAGGDSSAWSPALMRGGLGFFVAFWLGYSLRVFSKLCGIFLGLFALGVLGLSQIGWITIQWDIAEGQLASLWGRLGQELESFQAFLQGSLPAAGMGLAGLVAGMRKK